MHVACDFRRDGTTEMRACVIVLFLPLMSSFSVALAPAYFYLFVGWQIHVYGFDHKAPLMLREVLKRLLDLTPHLKEGPVRICCSS